MSAFPNNPHERRRARRYSLSLPVDLTTMRGVTRNVSSTGVLFDAPAADSLRMGAEVRFRVALDTVVGWLWCRGRIVRLDRRDAGCSVASTIDDWKVECHTGTALRT